MGEAVESALIYAKGGESYPVVSVNLKWKDFLSHILKLNKQTHKVMVPYNNFSTKREMKKKIRKLKRGGKELGLDPLNYLDFQRRDAYIDPAKCMSQLKYNPDDISKAMQATVEICNSMIATKKRDKIRKILK